MKRQNSAEKRLAQSPISRAVSYYYYFHYYYDYLGPRGNSATCDVGQGEGRARASVPGPSEARRRALL